MGYSRQTMVNNRDECQRKESCYEQKISRNASLRTALENGISNCSDYADDINVYSMDAVIFSELYDRDSNMFNQSFMNDVVSLLDSLDLHLQSVQQQAHNDAQYWQGLIDEYDEEERKKAADNNKVDNNTDN